MSLRVFVWPPLSYLMTSEVKGFIQVISIPFLDLTWISTKIRIIHSLVIQKTKFAYAPKSKSNPSHCLKKQKQKVHCHSIRKKGATEILDPAWEIKQQGTKEQFFLGFMQNEQNEPSESVAAETPRTQGVKQSMNPWSLFKLCWHCQVCPKRKEGVWVDPVHRDTPSPDSPISRAAGSP